MNLLDNLSHESNYQFPRWPSVLSRSYSSLRTTDFRNDIPIENRDQSQRPDSSPKRILQHHVRIPTGSGPVSPPPAPTTSFDLDTKLDRFSAKPMSSQLRRRSTPVRIKSTSFSIPISKTKEEFSSQNFPKQTHEQRKVTHERKRKKQQAQILADKYAETDTWFQLKRSLSELKRLATTPEILNDSNTTCFNCDGQTLINNDEKKGVIFKSESGISSSFCSTTEANRTSLSTPQSLFSRPRTAKTSSRIIFDPLMVASKPIHPVLLTSNSIPSTKSRLKPRVSPLYRTLPITAPLTEEKRAQLLLSDLSNEDNPPNSISPSPPMFKIEQREIRSRKIPTPSPLTSTIKLKAQIPRCHSATDIKSSSSIPKHSLRFILICDQEHRIESWYHQYPFVHSDDLLTSFQSKLPQQKSIISAFFIDDFQSSKPKTFLQGKPFHINNDWKKYDLIFISNNIYEQIIIYLQTIINLIKSSGKRIQIYQINHEEDLKKQVKNICKQLQQQNI